MSLTLQTRTIHRFKTKEELLLKANKDSGSYFVRNERIAFMGEYPTLTDLRKAYGEGTDVQWLLPQIGSLVMFTGAKMMDEEQQRYLARIIATDYHFLKITELLIFFHKFAAGEYGKFYGSVDALTIMEGLRDFMNYRIYALQKYEQEEQEEERQEEEKKNPPLSLQEWREIKAIIAMYNSDYTIEY